MDVYIMAYAKPNALIEVRNNLQRYQEYQTYFEKLTALKEQYKNAFGNYQHEVTEVKEQKLKTKEMREKVRELDQAAEEKLKPMRKEIKELEKKLEELEPDLLLRELSIYAKDEIDKIRGILAEVGVTNTTENKVLCWGKVGRSGVLNLRCETDKGCFKEIKRRLSEATFTKIEVLVEG